MDNPKSSRSTRTAIPPTPTAPKGDKAPKSSKPETISATATDSKDAGLGGKITFDSLIKQFLSIFMSLVHICHQIFEAVADVIAKIFRIILFCYRKPKHAKELFLTTIHLIKVSYDAEIWSWTQLFDILKSQLINPMSKAPPPPPPVQAEQKVK
ncbi:unnamed protein product [Caenorhabditis bovis]|uniref:Uncharacterized protein n=2 Tax=Caenorhabditis bovis TaxID=2654633 RepID=A0A8S1F8N2_9PELO|nr:unnamed protein product [Caenorhabditis bovis]